MLAEWSVECAAEDPVLVVPWKDPTADAHLSICARIRTTSMLIPEAEHYPPLMQALRALNATRSPVFTAKCDVWVLDREEVARLVDELDMTAERGLNGYCELYRSGVAGAPTVRFISPA